MAHVHISGTQRCENCGRFIADADLPRSLLCYEPLSEFGPELIAWTCPACAEKWSFTDAQTPASTKDTDR